MSTFIQQPPFHERRMGERRRYPSQALAMPGSAFRVSWAGIWSGVLTVVGLLLLLTTLGLAIGILAMEDGGTGRLGQAAGIWAGVSLLVALFVGGMISTRLAMITDKTTGFFEGALVWVVSVLLMLYLAASGVGLLATGAFNIISGVGTAVSSVAGTADALTQGNVDQILARLQSPQTAQQIATATGMPVAEVRRQLDETVRAVQNVRDNPSQAVAEARQRISAMMAQVPTERIQRVAARSAWATFIAFVLSLAAAVGGAMLGRSTAAKRLARLSPQQRAPAA